MKRRPKAKWVVEYVKKHDQKGRGSSQAIQHFKVFFSTTRTVDTNGNIHRTVLHNSGSTPFSSAFRSDGGFSEPQDLRSEACCPKNCRPALDIRSGAGSKRSSV